MEGDKAARLNAQLRARGVLTSERSWDTISTNDCRHKFFVDRTCGQHVAYRTRAAVHRNPTTLECPVCNPGNTSITNRRGRARVVSPDEAKLWEMAFGPGVEWSLQDRVPGWMGAVDVCVYLPLQHWLCIQVDGITHRGKPMSDRREQLAKDDQFNATAISAGYSVLRLDARHHAGNWKSALQQALDHCKSAGNPPTLFHSHS